MCVYVYIYIYIYTHTHAYQAKESDKHPAYQSCSASSRDSRDGNSVNIEGELWIY